MAETARELFEHELRDIYDAENKLIRSIASMSKKVKDPSLKQSLQEHMEVTKEQAARLEKVFGIIGRKPRREPCKGIDGLISEFVTFAKEESPSPEILDLFAAGAAAKVEHYEMSAYLGLINLAGLLGLDEAVDLLEQNRDEEIETAEMLEAMAEKLGANVELGEIDGNEARKKAKR